MGKPVIVISAPPISVVVTASREARSLGVHSTQSEAEARRLCRNGVFIVSRMSVYKAESCKIMSRLAAVTMNSPMEIKGLDEVYIDVTALCDMGNNDTSVDQAVVLGDILRKVISQERGLSCTVGISTTKNMAKLACEDAKPAGLKVIRDNEKVKYLRPRLVSVLSGIGPKREEMLKKEGYDSVGKIQDSEIDLVELFGKQIGRDLAGRLKRLAIGEDDEPVMQKPKKAINRTKSFRPKAMDLNIIKQCLMTLAAGIEAEVKQLGVEPMSLNVTVCRDWPTTITRSKAMSQAITDKQSIYEHGLHLLEENNLLDHPLRSLSVGVTKWKSAK